MAPSTSSASGTTGAEGTQESHQSIPSHPGSHLRRLGKAHSDNTGSDIFNQKCRERSAPVGTGGQGGTGSSCCLQFPHISRSEACAHRVERVGPTAWGPRGVTLAEVRDGAEAQRADWHDPRFFGSVGNASLDSLPSGHNQIEGRSWKLQAGIYEPYPH